MIVKANYFNFKRILVFLMTFWVLMFSFFLLFPNWNNRGLVLIFSVPWALSLLAPWLQKKNDIHIYDNTIVGFDAVSRKRVRKNLLEIISCEMLEPSGDKRISPDHRKRRLVIFFADARIEYLGTNERNSELKSLIEKIIQESR